MTRTVRCVILLLLFLTAAAVTASAAGADPKSEVRAIRLDPAAAVADALADGITLRESVARMLDRIASMNFNTVIVSLQADGAVAWRSALEPLMAPLRFLPESTDAADDDFAAIVADEARSRNLEVHAALSPVKLGASSKVALYGGDGEASHPAVEFPELTVTRGDSLILDTTADEVRDFLVRLVGELVHGYDFDGVNFEDLDAVDDEDDRYILLSELSDAVREADPRVKVSTTLSGGDTVYDIGYGYSDDGLVDFVIISDPDFAARRFEDTLPDGPRDSDPPRFIAGVALSGSTDPSERLADIEDILRLPEGRFSGIYFTDRLPLADPALSSLLADRLFSRPAHVVAYKGSDLPEPEAPADVEQDYYDGEYVVTWDDTPEADGDFRYYSVYVCRPDGTLDFSDVDLQVAHAVNGGELRYPSADRGLRFVVTAFDRDFNESLPAAAVTEAAGLAVEPSLTVNRWGETVTLYSPVGINSVGIYDMSGTLLRSQSVNQESYTIDGSGYRRGLYVVDASLGDGSRDALKIAF